MSHLRLRILHVVRAVGGVVVYEHYLLLVLKVYVAIP